MAESHDVAISQDATMGDTVTTCHLQLEELEQIILDLQNHILLISTSDPEVSSCTSVLEFRLEDAAANSATFGLSDSYKDSL